MKEIPILFSGEEVRSTLRGARTQVRRQIRERDVYQHEDGRWIVRFHGARVGLVAGSKDCAELANCDSPYGSRRDRLWVRETHGSADRYYQGHENDVPSVIAYRADQSAIQFNAPHPVAVPARDTLSWNWDLIKWSPSTFMPRWASRITLPLVEVRIERVQAITEADARAEGVADLMGDGTIDGPEVYGIAKGLGCSYEDARAGFGALWSATYGRESWEANPWVWVLGWSKAQVRP